MGGGLLLFMCGGAIWAWRDDVKKWNKGICPHCNKGVWKSYSCDSGGNSAYECTHCGISWWESGYGSKIELNPNDPQVRRMKMNNIRNRMNLFIISK